jgi:hypothetical protein
MSDTVSPSPPVVSETKEEDEEEGRDVAKDASPPSVEPFGVAVDMETADPDDFLMLVFLASHPAVRLRCVTVTPGAPAQVAVVVWALRELGYEPDWQRSDRPEEKREAPSRAEGEAETGGRPVVFVGAHSPQLEKYQSDEACVNPWHYRSFPGIPKSFSAYGDAADIQEGKDVLLAEMRRSRGTTTLVTGAPLKNMWAALQHLEQGADGNEDDAGAGETAETGGASLGFQRWVCQGGFAGVGVVPDSVPTLAKFQGKKTCATFNFNGCPAGAVALLDSELIGERRLVGKNCCHRAVYNQNIQERAVRAVAAGSHSFDERRRRGLELIIHGLQVYLGRGKTEKKVHDVLAAAAAVDASVCSWAEVRPYREKVKRGAEWGCHLLPGSNTFAAVDFDSDALWRILFGEAFE